MLYYYEYGVGRERGLVKVGDDYYFTESKGKVVVDQKYYAWKTSCELEKGQYLFDAEGKMVGSGAGEIVSIDGVLYYYEYGVGRERGLVYIDGYYYFTMSRGKLVVDQVFNVYNANGMIAEKKYTFNELGQIIG